MYLHTIMVCTDDITIDMCLCVLFAASGVVYYWMNIYCGVVCVCCAPMQTLYRYGCICVHFHVTLYH